MFQKSWLFHIIRYGGIQDKELRAGCVSFYVRITANDYTKRGYSEVEEGHGR